MYSIVVKKIVYDFYHRHHFTIRKISFLFNISKSSVGRWIHSSFSIKKRKPKYSYFTFINKFLSDFIISHPRSSLTSLQKSIFTTFKIKLSLSTIHKYLSKLSFI